MVTSGGNLKPRFVFHGITICRSQKGFVLFSRDLITQIMESCFYHADTLHVEKKAFPLLGTGAGEFSKRFCLDTMFRFRYLLEKPYEGLTCVKEVRIVLIVK